MQIRLACVPLLHYALTLRCRKNILQLLTLRHSTGRALLLANYHMPCMSAAPPPHPPLQPPLPAPPLPSPSPLPIIVACDAVLPQVHVSRGEEAAVNKTDFMFRLRPSLPLLQVMTAHAVFATHAAQVNKCRECAAACPASAVT